MAIHPDFPGLEVEIVVDKQPVKEYEGRIVDEDEKGDDAVNGRQSVAGEPVVPNDTDGKAAAIKTEPYTIYIEAKPSANFSVRMRVKPDFEYLKDNLQFVIEVDGVISKAKIFSKEKHVHGRRIDTGSLRVLTKSSMESTNETHERVD